MYTSSKTSSVPIFWETIFTVGNALLQKTTKTFLGGAAPPLQRRPRGTNNIGENCRLFFTQYSGSGSWRGGWKSAPFLFKCKAANCFCKKKRFAVNVGVLNVSMFDWSSSGCNRLPIARSSLALELPVTWNCSFPLPLTGTFDSQIFVIFSFDLLILLLAGS